MRQVLVRPDPTGIKGWNSGLDTDKVLTGFQVGGKYVKDSNGRSKVATRESN
jgi:hypothetical protein